MRYEMTPEEAAKIMGVRPEKVRQWMREKTMDLGLVIPPKNGKVHYEYHVYRAKLEKIIGEPVVLE